MARRRVPDTTRRTHVAIIALLLIGCVLGFGAVSPRQAAASASTFPASELLVRFSDTPSSIVVLTYDDARAAERAYRMLIADPGVDIVEPNVRRYLAWEPTDEAYDNQSWWLNSIHAPGAWDITTGRDTVIVAVIDSGVSPTHPDLAGRMVAGFNVIDGSANTADISGHGTHVAGIIAAQGANDVGTAGVAMDVRVMPIRVVSEQGEISVADEIAAIYWAVDNGADVINLSLGSDEYIQLEREAIQYATSQGVIVVAAAGNQVSGISYPAHYAETISVGALTATGQPTAFTSRVTRVDIAAPGESIFSPGWDEFFGDYWSDVFYSDSRPVTGTSFSAAMISGAAALLKSVAPEYGADEVRSALTTTAMPVSPSGPVAGTGAGQVNVEAAVRGAVYGPMHATWRVTDNPVASGAASRTWLWGVGPNTHAYEPYAEAQHGTRLIYYFDKSRMEVTDPLHDRSDRWYVTNGLLVSELISGQLQLGDALFEPRSPAVVNVAGDPDDAAGPTYASFSGLLNMPAIEQDNAIVLTIDRAGRVGADSRFAGYGVTAVYFVPETGHRVASVFWEYLNSHGLVDVDGALIEGPLFEPWFYATGLPVTEGFWARVKVANVYRDVLIQCFERRCMTYTPANSPGWHVEMGNVGQHYYAWRYQTAQSAPNPTLSSFPASPLIPRRLPPRLTEY
ncbi:MAG TPA: S8 family serine peptidase [Thermomicrobiales bacterium]|nr:S8 family serine peptidase [Thermomicrobiales bacterium]